MVLLRGIKVHLVAQGFHQQAQIDYHETFCHVVKPAIIHLGLSLTVFTQRSVHQLNVKNAFLHRHLTEEVYMKQPPSFIHPDFP